MGYKVIVITNKVITVMKEKLCTISQNFTFIVYEIVPLQVKSKLFDLDSGDTDRKHV